MGVWVRVCLFLGVDNSNESLQKDKSTMCVYCSKFVMQVHVLIVCGQHK